MSIDQVINAAPIPPLPGQLDGLDVIAETKTCNWGLTTGRCSQPARDYKPGPRCPQHTPSALEGKPEPPEMGRCPKCSQQRLLFVFSYVPRGWMEFVEVGLCTPCFSAATLQDEQDEVDFIEPATGGAR